jgi:hypothetical protein
LLRWRLPPIAQTLPFVLSANMPLALCSAIWNAYACRGSPSSSFGPRDEFLHSPPMVESSGAVEQTAPFFNPFARRTIGFEAAIRRIGVPPNPW